MPHLPAMADTRALALLALVAAALAGCKTTEPAASQDEPHPYLLVETEPAGARLSFPDGTTCETPCPVNVTETMRMEVAKAGYEKLVYTLYGNEPGYLMIEMEKAAPTTQVEEVSLPDL